MGPSRQNGKIPSSIAYNSVSKCPDVMTHFFDIAPTVFGNSRPYFALLDVRAIYGSAGGSLALYSTQAGSAARTLHVNYKCITRDHTSVHYT